MHLTDNFVKLSEGQVADRLVSDSTVMNSRHVESVFGTTGDAGLSGHAYPTATIDANSITFSPMEMSQSPSSPTDVRPALDFSPSTGNGSTLDFSPPANGGPTLDFSTSISGNTTLDFSTPFGGGNALDISAPMDFSPIDISKMGLGIPGDPMSPLVQSAVQLPGGMGLLMNFFQLLGALFSTAMQTMTPQMLGQQAQEALVGSLKKSTL